MHREGHVGVALLVFSPVAFVLFAIGASTLAVFGGAIVAAGSMLPDLDMRVPFIKHRGPTHTVWAALLVGLVGGLVGVVLGSSVGLLTMVLLGVYGAFIGALTILAHLVGDVLTPMGIRPLVPIDDRKYCLDVVRAANPVANYGLLVAGAVLVAVAAAGGISVNGVLA